MKIKFHNSFGNETTSKKVLLWSNDEGRVCCSSFRLFKRRGVRISFGEIGKDTETGNLFFCPERKEFLKVWERKE